MRRGVFLTGGAGFVGRRFLEASKESDTRLVVLDRSGKLKSSAPRGVELVFGDVLDPATYRDALATCDVVVHLAAATGNASREEHHRVNAEGTEVLLDAARREGVTRFLFVSSVAVTFPDLQGYHYAEAKARAEAMVRTSGLRFLIIRPTMILGPGAPILASLEKLATLPVALLPGSGRTRVQPIHVDDVAFCLLKVLEADAFANETIGIAGPETLSIEALIRRIRLARRGRTGPLVRVPLPLLQIPLRALEAVGVGRLLPLSAGQLSSFRFDGIGEANRVQAGIERRGLDAMLQPAATQAQPLADLNAECEIFTRYLLGHGAGDYVRAKYRAAHGTLPALEPQSAFDGFLVRFARRGRVLAKLADSHAALFAQGSLLRKKLVLLLAILETSPQFHRMMDAPVGGRPIGALLALTATGTSAVLSLVVGALILLPIQAVFAVGSRSAR